VRCFLRHWMSGAVEYLFNEAATRRRSNFMYTGDESGLSVSTEPQRELERVLWEESRAITDWGPGFKITVSDLFKTAPKWLNVELATADAQIQTFQRVQFGDEMHQVWREGNHFVRSQPLLGEIRWKNEFAWRPIGSVTVLRNWKVEAQGSTIWELRKDGPR
jgi:hypothetical protein